MTPDQYDSKKLLDGLRSFLDEAGWVEAARKDGQESLNPMEGGIEAVDNRVEKRPVQKVAFFIAPESLGIQGRFSVALPLDPTVRNSAGLLHGAANSLVDIYGYGSLGDLLNRAAATLGNQTGPTRFIARFVDSTIRNGSMPLSSLVAYTSSIQAGLYRSAKFKLGSESKENHLIAQRFAKDCLFMQTEEGSFIAKVEIPNLVLKQGDLFGGEVLASAEVCSALFSAMQFLNLTILGADDPFDTPELLADAITLFDVELLKSLTEMVIDPEVDTIDFAIEIGPQRRTSSTGVLSPEKKQRLKDFFDFVHEQLRGENGLDVTGSIVELRSRDPEGNKNYIRVVTEFHGDKSYVSAILNNEQYQQAVDAHKQKRHVRLKGNGTRLKTHVRMNGPIEFVA
jgi:hypothetical protein